MNKYISTVIFIVALSSHVWAQEGPMFHQDISWSPDGRYIAFCGMHDLDRQTNKIKADIYVMRSDGNGLKSISSPDKNEYYTSWSGKRIAFGSEVVGTKDSNIWTSDRDGQNLRQLTKNSKRNSAPALSRNGKSVAFVSTRDSEKYQIYAMNADGSDVRRLTSDDNIGYFNPQWSPDGKMIVYYAEKGDQKDQIWVMNRDGTGQRLLTNDVGHNIFPGWSPDGRMIIFSSSNRDKKTDGSYVDGSYLYLINIDGSGLRKLGNIQSHFARFSPDGKKLAYASGKFPSTAIYVAKADGSEPVRITK